MIFYYEKKIKWRNNVVTHLMKYTLLIAKFVVNDVFYAIRKKNLLFIIPVYIIKACYVIRFFYIFT